MTHLTLEQRCKIEAFHGQKFSITQIAALLGKNKSVISREISRNCDERNGAYKAGLAQRKMEKRHQEKSKKIHFTEEIRMRVVTFLKDDFSPEQIVGICKKKGLACVSAEHLYQFIWHDKKQGGKLYTHLRTKGKRYAKRANLKGRRGIIKERIGIENRPEIVNEKERIGDFEVDLVIGKDHKGALLTINDSATGVLKMAIISTKESHKVADKIIELLEIWLPYLHTITSDNGKEFAAHKRIAEALSIDYFFANPYSSWERGANVRRSTHEYQIKKTDNNE